MTVVETKHILCREASSLTHGDREATSLLGPIGRGMRLKVSCDKLHTSDIIELASRRCLVGSAPGCHVRVDEPGVAPIECLLIQGSKNNVVRWLDASQEFAGGELFEDEILLDGDPLQIGTLELELLVDEIMSAEEPPKAEQSPEISEDRLTEYILRLGRLETQLVELQQASELTASLSDAMVPANDEVAATVCDLATQLAVLQSRSASDRALWAGEKAELESLLRSRLREFDFLQDEVQRLRDELVTVRSEFGNRSADEDASEHLAEVAQELAERTEQFEQQQTNWERDRSEFQCQLRQNIERLEQFEAQLARQSEHQAESEAARQAAEARADRLQESVEELSKRLAEQQSDFETVRAAWEANRASLESELAETKQRLVQSTTAESAGLELRESWDRERTELKSQVDEAISRAEEIQEELEAQRRHLEEHQQSRYESRPDERETDQPSEANEQRLDREISVAPDNPMDRLLAGTSPVDDRDDGPLGDFLALKPMIRDDAESENPDDSDSEGGYGCAADVASNYYEPAFSGLQSAAYLDDATSGDCTFENPLLAATKTGDYGAPFESTESVIEEEQEVAFESASSAPSESTADVLARLGQLGVWSDDETEADGSNAAQISDAGNSPNDVFSRVAAPATTEPESEQPQYGPLDETPFDLSTTDATGDAEESIEVYMARLMNRVRGTDDRGEPSCHAQPTVERSPVTEYTEVMKAARPEPEAETLDPEEYKPRSQAPELADRMTAMRRLANDSARTAIASHAKRNWSSVMQLKLFVSVFAFVAVLASTIFFWGDPLLMGLGSLVGVGVLAYWARNAITYRQLLLDSLMFEPEDGDYDEPASDGDAG